MFTLKCAELLVGLISFLLVYFFAITVAGFFRAWVAKKMGDTTAEQAGFLTLNPLVHMDILGMAFLCTSYFGWGRIAPINPHNIDGTIRFREHRHTGWRIPKLLCAFFADSFVYFCMGFCALVSLVGLFGPLVLAFASSMLVCSGCMSHLLLAHAFPQYSSLTIMVGFILIVLAYLCIVMGVLDFLINCCQFGITLLAERSPEAMFQYSYMALFAPMILILFGAAKLRLLVTGLMLHGGWAIAYFLGLI